MATPVSSSWRTDLARRARAFLDETGRAVDQFAIAVSPSWGQSRMQARARVNVAARHFEAAQGGRRTDGWQRRATDANTANAPAIGILRDLSRDLARNNGWARRGIEVIANNVIGWGILPKAGDNRSHARIEQARITWDAWANKTACDYDGRMNFYGLQALVTETVALSGECLLLKQPAATVDGLPVPIRVQVLEPDYLDTTRTGLVSESGGPILNGIEFDKQGRRVAYWLYTSHPGGIRLMTSRFESARVPADRVIHVYRVERPGQMRGVPWLASAIARLKDLDDYEDAELMQQKVAACFAAFVTNTEGGGTALGDVGTDSNGNEIESLEPGHIEYLNPGETVTFATPPRAQDGAFSARSQRRVAVSLGVTYEEMTGDYSNVNFSSARMARLAHWQNVHRWREHMIIPTLCVGVWGWVMGLAANMNGWPSIPTADWVAPPMPILEPDKEGLAYQRLIRNGLMTWPQAIRELGQDPVTQLAEIAKWNTDADAAGIVLDSDPRKVTQVGQLQLGVVEDDGSVDVDLDDDDEDADDPAVVAT